MWSDATSANVKNIYFHTFALVASDHIKNWFYNSFLIITTKILKLKYI